MATKVIFSSGQILRNVHSDGTCYGEFCPIHKPSSHNLLQRPLTMIGQSMFRILQDKSLVIDPDDYAYNNGKTVIAQNSAKCLSCDETVSSTDVHDFVKCSCGNVFVDGGYDYIRHGFKDSSTYENTSITFTKD